ncbi:uncharacterized protein LOC102719325 isoform X2 [Oryza brachyantha]|uniref:WIYLD domain-containing protein n=2 Tax=Oryza brachyantha TaxID=4533 RepID=J3MVL1_ORYBR|nr:uncharacterized protein LOC102719325 isoform X2 [Oryza brachyantha]
MDPGCCADWERKLSVFGPPPRSVFAVAGAMPRPRTKKGERRIDAAIDHFIPMGYATSDIQTVIKQLLEVYGKDGWRFLEEDSYRVVQEALFEKQEYEERRQLQLLQQQQPVDEQQEEPQEQLEESIDEVQYEAPEPTVVDSMLVDLPADKPILPLPEATVTYSTRRPCYGWIVEYESESDDEEHPSNQKDKLHVPDPQSVLCKRKRPSRWDIKPLN